MPGIRVTHKLEPKFNDQEIFKMQKVFPVQILLPS